MWSILAYVITRCTEGSSSASSVSQPVDEELQDRACGQPDNPQPTSEGRRRNMQAIRRANTKPEVAIRSALHRAGLRFRKDLRLDLGEVKPRPDIVFTRARLAVFIDGCFWHACPDHSKPPSVNRAYWGPKLERNVERDRRYDAALMAAGWSVVRIWEHEDNVADVVEQIRRLVTCDPEAGSGRFPAPPCPSP